MSLPTKLLRLAHAKPESRKHLLPLLRSAGVALPPDQELLWDQRTRPLTAAEREWVKEHIRRHRGEPLFGIPSHRYGQRVEFNTKLWLVYDTDKSEGAQDKLILVSPDGREMIKGVPVGLA